MQPKGCENGQHLSKSKRARLHSACTVLARESVKNMIMEVKKLQFTSKPGTFIDSIRAYREYKKEWRARMDVKLTEMEEQIKRAKSDPFFKMEMV